jgi:ATP-binding cassette subfamily C protein
MTRALLSLCSDLASKSGRWRTVQAASLIAATLALDGANVLILVALIGLDQGTVRHTQIFQSDSMPEFLRSFTGLLVAWIGVLLLRSWVAGQRDICLERVRRNFVATLRSQLFSSMTEANWPLLSRSRTSDVQHALTLQGEKISLGLDSLFQVPNIFLLSLVTLITGAVVAPRFMVAAVLLGGLVFLLLRKFLMSTAMEERDAGRGDRRLFAEIGDFLSSVKWVKSHGAEHHHQAAFETAVQERVDHALDRSRQRAKERVLMSLAIGSALCAALVIAQHWVTQPPARLALLVVLVARLAPQTGNFHRLWERIATMLPAFTELQKMKEAYRCGREHTSNAVVERVAIRFGVELKDVDFSYPGQRALVLAKLNVSFPAGSVSVITGATGAGKTTLADLVLGLQRPQHGRMTVDGQELDERLLPSWRQSVAYVTQDCVLVNDTLRANLFWANGEPNDNAGWKVLEIAAADFVARLPKGLDTPIGERGVRLSGGERQRIAIARALLRKPALLILDEATNALDPDTERRLLQALMQNRNGMTILAISHRPAILEHADYIFRLAGGRLVEEMNLPHPVSHPRVLGATANC